MDYYDDYDDYDDYEYDMDYAFEQADFERRLAREMQFDDFEQDQEQERARIESELIAQAQADDVLIEQGLAE